MGRRGTHSVSHVTVNGWLLARSYFSRDKTYVMTYHNRVFRSSSKDDVVTQVEQAMDAETDPRYLHRIKTGYWPS